MNFQNIQMNNGTVLTATKTEELVRYIVNKFSRKISPMMKLILYWKIQKMF